MSYHKDLEEYTFKQIKQELNRRNKCKENKICSYCGRNQDSLNTCRYPEIHREFSIKES